ncbi:hypothetical protein G3N59_34505 [Paraburkholderia sp. Ac-20340]|uniref:hypothetical protein n=1 Tax=Paraburkholderia sp. Ac-20340 TaxID=2703888 RepID=UPI00197DAF71|nr:hypothetical protein [Paraburkholderia sp. Ac-20340]MBN3858513.1 hypothetical protein [Paraburkholderia sp. Ac-20340]
MSPLSLLIDHSQLMNRVQTLYSFAPSEAGKVEDEQTVSKKEDAKREERLVQIKGLVGGTLLFMPFLIAYVVACASR